MRDDVNSGNVFTAVSRNC